MSPRLSRWEAAAAPPSRATIWRHIRALRYQPPGRAYRGDRKHVFCSALEQAEQLFTAAETIGYASRPIQLFYGLSQAGRAIAAASTAADNNNFRLTGHGIKAPSLNQRPPLHELTVIDEGTGSFTQLAPMLRSGTLPDGAQLGQIWASIPGLLDQPLARTSECLPPLRFEVQGFVEPQEVHGWVHGLPARLGGAADPERAVRDFLAGYPSLAGSSPSRLADGIIPDDPQTGSGMVVRCWPWPDPIDPAKYVTFLEDFEDRRTLPYRGNDDRWVFPALGGDKTALHPLLAWWALLFALSMLARYEPASWTSHLDVDASPNTVPLESALGHALDACPQLILDAIRAVGS